MKITTQKNNSKRYSLLVLFVVLILAGAGGIYIWAQSTQTTPKSNSANTDTSSKANPSSNDPATKAPTSIPSNVDPNKSTDEIPVSNSLSVSITSLSQEGQTVQYTAKVSGATAGSCSALFTNQLGKPVTHTSETSDGTCRASIPAAEFDALGSWDLKLIFYHDNTKASSPTQTITIR